MRTPIAALAAVAVVIAAGGALAGSSSARSNPAQDDDAKPRYTIKQVMQDVHKGGLLKKVQSGKASKEEKLKLLEYYVAMYESEPKKGEPESWSRLAGAAVAASAKLVVDEKADPKILRSATNCKACHDLHK